MSASASLLQYTPPGHCPELLSIGHASFAFLNTCYPLLFLQLPLHISRALAAMGYTAVQPDGEELWLLWDETRDKDPLSVCASKFQLEIARQAADQLPELVSEMHGVSFWPP